MHLNQYLLGVVTLVEICTTVVAPVLEHSELYAGEVRPEASRCLYQLQNLSLT